MSWSLQHCEFTVNIKKSFSSLQECCLFIFFNLHKVGRHGHGEARIGGANSLDGAVAIVVKLQTVLTLLNVLETLTTVSSV